MDLEGYYKLYADKKRIRIIYEEIDHTIRIVAIDEERKHTIIAGEFHEVRIHSDH